MKKVIQIILALTLTHFIYGQNDKDSTYNDEGDIVSLDLLYGTLLLRQGFNDQVNTLKRFEFFEPIQSIGISLNVAYVREGEHNYGIHVSYSQIIPQKIQVNDTINGKINGFNFSWNFYGLDLTPKSKYSSIILGAGFNTGRLRIKSDSLRSQKNPFFAPAIFFNPRLFIGHFSFGFRADYQFDISKTGWRSVNLSNKTNTFSPLNLKQTGLITYLSLGWSF